MKKAKNLVFLSTIESKINSKACNRLIKISSFNFLYEIQMSERERNFFFKKQEYERSYKFLSEEMRDSKSILVYSRKFPYYNINFEPYKFGKYLFYNSVMYLFYVNGIYNFMFIWIASNILILTRLIFLHFKNSRKISSIFLIKTQNDFTPEAEFYFMIGYGLFKKVEVINLINFDINIRQRIEKNLFFMDDTRLINLGYNIEYIHNNGNMLIFNKDIFRHFFKQEKQINDIKSRVNHIEYELV